MLRIEVEIAHLQNELVEAENNYFVSQTELKILLVIQGEHFMRPKIL